MTTIRLFLFPPWRAVRTAFALAIVLAASAADAQFNIHSGKVVLQAAETWLADLDNEQYSKVWTQSSKLFRERSDQREWAMKTEAFRAALGKIQYRSLTSLIRHKRRKLEPFMATLNFKAAYENYDVPVETILVVLEDGRWKVAGYAAKPEEKRQ